MRTAAIAIICLLCLADPAVAEHRCRVPLGDWQPREALQAKLEQQGWTVLSIRADDGCYKVRARNANGLSATPFGIGASSARSGGAPRHCSCETGCSQVNGRRGRNTASG